MAPEKASENILLKQQDFTAWHYRALMLKRKKALSMVLLITIRLLAALPCKVAVAGSKTCPVQTQTNDAAAQLPDGRKRGL